MSIHTTFTLTHSLTHSYLSVLSRNSVNCKRASGTGWDGTANFLFAIAPIETLGPTDPHNALRNIKQNLFPSSLNQTECKADHSHNMVLSIWEEASIYLPYVCMDFLFAFFLYGPHSVTHFNQPNAHFMRVRKVSKSGY
jgi:hypothetical protein